MVSNCPRQHTPYGKLLTSSIPPDRLQACQEGHDRMTNGRKDDALEECECNHANSLLFLDGGVSDEDVLDRAITQTCHGSIEKILVFMLRTSTVDCESQGQVFDSFFNDSSSQVREDGYGEKVLRCLRASKTSIGTFSKVIR
jgi:hypothetical protein